MRPTTKDLALAAGVSLATVDRVLNGRTGVHQKTVTAVHDAIREIGFERNQIAATLARKRGYRFGFVLPQDGDAFLAEIMSHIKEINDAGRAEMLEVKALVVDEQNPHNVAQFLTHLDAGEYDGVAIMAPETPQIRDAIRRMRSRGIHTIAFVSNQHDSLAGDFVGIDNTAAGATAGRLMGRFAGGRVGSVAVITDTMQSRDSLERRLGFDALVNRSYPGLTVLPSLETYSDPERAGRIVATTLAAHPDLVGVYIMGSEARLPLEALCAVQTRARHILIAHERTPATLAALRSGQLDAVITQDPGHLVRSAVRILRAKCENRQPVASQEKIRIEILIQENL